MPGRSVIRPEDVDLMRRFVEATAGLTIHKAAEAIGASSTFIVAWRQVAAGKMPPRALQTRLRRAVTEAMGTIEPTTPPPEVDVFDGEGPAVEKMVDETPPAP